jgi:Thaumatin family
LAPYVAKVPSGPGGVTSDQTSLLLNSTRLCQVDSGSREACPTGYSCSGENGTCVRTCTSNSDCNGGECDQLPNGQKYCQCQSQKDCASSPLGKFCGSQFGVGLGFYLQECGPFAGWWSAGDFCSDPTTSYGPFNCGQLFTDAGGTNQTNLSSLFLCADKNGNPANGTSCYNTGGPTNECCGCATSNDNKEYDPPLGKYWPAPTCADEASNPTCCENNNSVWATKVQPWLASLKQACPTAYTYPFDDLTSTYECQAKGDINLLGYQITFDSLVVPTPLRLSQIANKAAKQSGH